MTPVFVILALLTVAGSIAALGLRNLVHCALALTVALAGLAALYLQLGSQFIGFAQFLVYVGAVAILIVFAILLTRGGEAADKKLLSPSWCSGIGVSIAVFIVLAWTLSRSSLTHQPLSAKAEVPVKRLGEQLMTQYLLPLEVIGLLLTVALIGAVIIAMQEKEMKKPKEEQ